jgi:hypothetical protein
MCYLRRADGCLSAGGRSGVFTRHDDDLLQRLVSRLLARSRQSRDLGRSRHHDHRWLRAHGNRCSLSVGLYGRLCASQLLPDLFDLLNLYGELRADLLDVFHLRSRVFDLFDVCRKLRPDLLNLHCWLCADMLDLCRAGHR